MITGLPKVPYTALKKLKEFYVVTERKSQSTEIYFITTGKEPNLKSLGTITFHEGKLDWISRNWGNFNMTNNPMEFASTLFAALEGAAAASGSTATIRTKISRIPSGEIKQIDFVFSDRKITTLISDGPAQGLGKQAGIDESVSAN